MHHFHTVAALSAGLFVATVAATSPLVPAETALASLDRSTHTSYRVKAGDAIVVPASHGTRAPAPPLTRVLIVAVASTQNGGQWEYMSTPDQLSTVQDHGGAQLRAAILEVGYGSPPSASMNGGVLPRSAEYAAIGLCANDGYYTDCRPGQTIVAWNRFYQLDGEQGGNFRYQNTSTNPPRGTLSTQIYIR
ncbi:MAG: hypothetical protein GAK31_02039 [Stenotrophomonas maltophilia]|uniref:DUF4879 domain-containing protein n=1 Tax=Stenotrophomonas maltophilia TaxID=40324 RepID=A0A7V8JKX8_STEMA|nr:MAG: hypothetical protein GAK31_02039 [Stenotrophomonas maltophilia]